MRRTYPTDLSDAEWGCLEPHLPAAKATGRPRVYPLREILNAIFYVVRSGCSWRLVPHELDFEKASRSYWIVRRDCSRALPTCGWTEGIQEKTKVESGYRRRSGIAWRSSASHARLLGRKCLWPGPGSG